MSTVRDIITTLGVAGWLIILAGVVAVGWRTVHEERRKRRARARKAVLRTPPPQAHPNCRCALIPVGRITATLNMRDEFTPGLERIKRQLITGSSLTADEQAQAVAGIIPDSLTRYLPNYPRNLEAMRAYANAIDRQMLDNLTDDERAELGLTDDVDACLAELERLE